MSKSYETLSDIKKKKKTAEASGIAGQFTRKLF